MIFFNSANLNTVFSFPVCETQMQWSVLAREYWRNALVTMALASAKPNNEWSVNTVHKPNKLPMNKAYKDNKNNDILRAC